jgi:PTH1 family peptidyl-tRNA hydrolase
LLSIIEQLGTEDFPRIRVGVGREDRRGDLADQVLAKLDPDRQQLLRKAVEAAAEAALSLIEKGLNETMNRFNGWSAEPPPAPEDRK